MKFLGFVFCFVCFCSHGETITDESEVSFDVTYLNFDVVVGNVGNGVIVSMTGSCGGSTCLENSGASFDINYELLGASNCYKISDPIHGGWGGLVESGDGEYTGTIASGVSQNTEFKLTCFDESISDFVSQSVFVELSIEESCSSNPPILNGAEDRTILANGTSQPGVYNGNYSELQGLGASNPWPGGWGDVLHLSLEKNKYISAKFTTDFNGYDGKFNLTASNSYEGPNPQGKALSISKCPGDFSVHLNQSRCYTETNSLYWSSKDVPGGPQGFFCELESNTTYFLNIVHSNNSENNNYSTSDCLSPMQYCGILAAQNEVTF